MEIVIISDNHGKIDVLKEILQRHPEADAYIHCGDSELSEEYLGPFLSVEGNNDVFYDYPEYRVIQIEDLKILIIHGHQYITSSRKAGLVKKAKSLGCSMVCYGHTHIFDVDLVEGISLLNPGSLRYNRDGSKTSYMVLYRKNQEVTIERKEI